MDKDLLRFIPLFSGSSGNALFAGTAKTKILIDAGLSASAITDELLKTGENPKEISAVLITHEHIDHIRGAGILSRKLDIPIYANEQTWLAMEDKLGNVALKNRCIIEQSCYIGDFAVEAFQLPHDSACAWGYKLRYKNKSIAVATDLGHVTKAVMKNLANTNLVLLEANHDLEMLKQSSYPGALKKRIAGNHGHLSNDSSAEAAAELLNGDVRAIILGHLSRENNTEELAYSTVAGELRRNGVKVGYDIALGIAFRNRCAGVFNI